MLASLTLLLGLPLALATGDEPHGCTPLLPVTLDKATIHGLLGQWFYITGASTYEPHLEEFKAVKYSTFSFSPGSHEDELRITESMRVNETCVVKNAKIQIFWHNSTLVHVDDQVASPAKLIQSDKDLLILKNFNDNFLSLSLSARTPNVSKEQLEEFKAHLYCLGFTEEDIFYASEKDACPLPEEKMDEGDAELKLG
ncbi:alpha-1-acid glycoprotein 1-like [Phalacrocorax aristotelis]|uniref:alpha-1-acid glycoprotein 1-like n=1 Tax=Phalacrocorax aristotelis TaxID=126867 RepID=UPI003F4BD64C